MAETFAAGFHGKTNNLGDGWSNLITAINQIIYAALIRRLNIYINPQPIIHILSNIIRFKMNISFVEIVNSLLI